MSAFSYISFPRKVDKSCLISRVDESDLRGILISDSHGAVFNDVNDVFTNQFIYDFIASFKNNNDNNSYLNIDSDEWRNLEKYWNEEDEICRQQLYEIVQTNIEPNEIVEIYTHWVDNGNNYNFGPPAEAVIIDAEQILSVESLANNHFCSGTKIEIRRII